MINLGYVSFDVSLYYLMPQFKWNQVKFEWTFKGGSELINKNILINVYCCNNLQLEKRNLGLRVSCHSIKFSRNEMKRMKKFMVTGWLENSREACFGGRDDKEFKGFKRAAFVLTFIKPLLPATKSKIKLHEIKNYLQHILYNIWVNKT